ncbi:sigma-70 family RNA polymerase sigma factor [Wenxinia marina]|uniref:RNA polymerase sigma factor, sigma-70 family n=1 Tax=Wenxinia marina DSM 24838 TaxID=1123501 RepID=A0A0D0QBK4_9RHOB|nr:sigma-70 family RNA polymerase sigma factor [Wenxinia marina]KIQ69652.1 RNA polymerase sigma factor, sigma-70 family [Wenxinia marina DSM 24838]GGL60052.1 RNA polymerase sigma factor [Wenxinia marina]
MDASGDDLEACIARVALGDRAAFRDLYGRTSGKLFGVCLRVLRDRGRAEDALQEAFVKVWANAGRYRKGRARPMTWLITIARNAAIDAARRRREETAGADDAAADMAAPGGGPEEAAIVRGEATRIVACMGELPEDRRAAVRGAYLGGQSYDDLARTHGVPLNTMRSWLRRALIALKECMAR